MVVSLARPWLDMVVSLEAPQSALRANHLASLVEEAIEWTVSVLILDGDIQKGYDYTKHNMVIPAWSAEHVLIF